MKTGTNQTLRMIIVFLCTVLLFGCLNTHASFLGPGLSQAATVQPVATQTDRLLPNEN